MYKLLMTLAVLAIAGCAQREHLKTSAVFDPNEVAWSRSGGNNSVSGFAVLRTITGVPRTCAGTNASLYPDSTYARSIVTMLYGNLEGGMRQANEAHFDVKEIDPEFLASARRVRCDALGNFAWEGVPDGTWYVAARVTWQVRRDRLEGASMMKRIELRGGQSVKVTLP